MSNSDEQNVKKTNAEEDAKIEQKSAEVKEDTPVAEAQVSAGEAKTEEVKAEEASAEETKTEEAPAEEAKTEEAPVAEAKTGEAPAEEASKEEEAPEEKKGFQARSTKPQRPTECASCGKAFVKKIWYYRNAAFYCNKKCYLTKTEADKQKAEADKQKAAEEAAKE